MANWHFGKISEVWKHGTLGEVLANEKPSRYAETHAGSADYPLTHSPERDYGVYWFVDHNQVETDLRTSAYANVLNDYPHDGGYPERCPGSPAVAIRTLRDAELSFFDLDRESVDTIRRDAVSFPHLRVSAQVEDGLASVAMAFASDPVGVVHIDPFEPFAPTQMGGPSPVELARTLAGRGTTVVYWYGYEGEETRFWAWDEIAVPSADASHWWVGDVSYAEPETDSGIVGSGVLVANASAASLARCASFGRAMERIYLDALLPSGRRGSLEVAFRDSG